MKRRIAIAVGVLIALAALVWLTFAVVVPPAVDVAHAQQRDVIDTLVATGQVVADDNPTATSEVAAPVVSVPVRQGDRVEAGDVIAELDATEAQREVERARATVEEARATLRAVTERGEPTAREDLQQAQRELESAREDYERARQLYEEGVGPRIDVEEARRAVDRAQSDLQRATTAYEQAAEDGTDFEQAAAAVARAEAEHRLAQDRLADYTIRAGADATVLTREVDPGDTVQPGGVIATLALEGPQKILIEPDERQLAQLQPGQPAIAAADAYPTEQFEAAVDRIDPAVDPETGTITARLSIDEPPEFLRSAMTVTVDIELDRQDDALIVPRQAVRGLDTASPWVLRIDDGRATAHRVDTGIDDIEFVQITDGLDIGDQIIADPDVESGDRVRPGDAVQLTPEDVEPLDPHDDPVDEPPPAAHRAGGQR